MNKEMSISLINTNKHLCRAKNEDVRHQDHDGECLHDHKEDQAELHRNEIH